MSYGHSAASSVVVLGIAGLAGAVALAGAWVFARAGTGERARRFALALGAAVAWMAATALVARSGVLLDFARRPPPMMLVMVASVAAGLAIGLGPVGARLARGLPLAVLVGFQA